MAKLTDKQKKKIITDYVECANYRQVSRKHGIPESTIRNIIKSNVEIAQICAQKNEQNTLDILNYLDNKAQKYKNFTDYLLDERLDPLLAKDSLTKLSEMQLVTIFGVLTDKLLKAKELKLKHKTDESFKEINDNLIAITKIIQNPQPAHKVEVDIDE